MNLEDYPNDDGKKVWLSEQEVQQLLDVSKRTLRHWMDSATDQLEDETDDPGWQYLGFHDLRHTWATQLRSAASAASNLRQWQTGWTSTSRTCTGRWLTTTSTPKRWPKSNENARSFSSRHARSPLSLPKSWNERRSYSAR